MTTSQLVCRVIQHATESMAKHGFKHYQVSIKCSEDDMSLWLEATTPTNTGCKITKRFIDFHSLRQAIVPEELIDGRISDIKRLTLDV